MQISFPSRAARVAPIFTRDRNGLRPAARVSLIPLATEMTRRGCGKTPMRMRVAVGRRPGELGGKRDGNANLPCCTRRCDGSAGRAVTNVYHPTLPFVRLNFSDVSEHALALKRSP